METFLYIVVYNIIKDFLGKSWKFTMMTSCLWISFKTELNTVETTIEWLAGGDGDSRDEHIE